MPIFPYLAGGDLQYISQTVLSADSSTISIANIPDNYTNLVVLTKFRDNEAVYVRDVYLRFNDDSTPSYHTTYLFARAGALSCSEILGATYAYGGSTPGNNAFANAWGNGILYLHFYADTAILKQGQLWLPSFYRDNAGQNFFIESAFVWKKTNAINKLTYFLTAGTLYAGSTIKLYGIV